MLMALALQRTLIVYRVSPLGQVGFSSRVLVSPAVRLAGSNRLPLRANLFMKKALSAFLLLFALVIPGLYAADGKPSLKDNASSTDHRDGIRVVPMQNPAQPFEMAAKLQWNPHDQRWDKVLVLYNGCPNPPAEHPAWAYLNALGLPDRKPSKPGENLAYRPFHLNAYCDGTTPLTSGKPLRVSFDQNTLGKYGEKDYFRDWNCPKWGMGLDNLAIVNGAESRTGKDQALRIKLAKGLSGCESDVSCISWKPLMGAQLDSLHYSYWVKFPENFDFVLGGKLPGIGNDNASAGGGKPNGHDGWSVRVMWDRHGKLGQYVYHMDQPSYFGDFLEWGGAEIQRGKWQQIKTFVKLNSPGKKDGIIRTWLDGREVLNKQDLRFRAGDDLKIERFLFSVFYGGSGPEWAPPHDMRLYLDEFVLSSSPQ